MPTTNTSPTIDDLRAIETEWNTAVNTEYSTVDARYPDINLSNVNLEGGSTLMAELHADTGEPLFSARRKDNLQPITIPRDVLNALRKKSILLDVTDDVIKHSCEFNIDSLGVVVAIGSQGTPLANWVDNENNTVLGLTTLLAANRVHIVTEDDGCKRIVIEPES